MCHMLLVIPLLILLYAWVLYPGLMWLVERRIKRTPPPAEMGREWPNVAVVFSAHKEEKVIGARLSNLSSLNYPWDRLQVFVGVDGAGDRTEAIARQWSMQDTRIHVFVRDQCQGKTSMLKKLIGEAGDHARALEEMRILSLGAATRSDDIPLLVFTDANTMFEKDALFRLVEPFANPRVGGVCGRLVFEGGKNVAREAAKPAKINSSNMDIQDKQDGVESGSSCKSCPSMLSSHSECGTDEPVYWDWETRIKTAESWLDSCLGANGAIYAIRGELFPGTIPDNTIVDDFVIGMKIREQGFRMIYEPGAVGREDLPESVQDEWRRRVRIGAGAYQALSLCRRCLSPRYGVFSLMFWSHKVLRWLTPHLMILLLGACCWLAGGWVRTSEGWMLNLAGVGVASIWLAVMVVYSTSSRCRKLIGLAWYFCVMQAALFVGFLKFCRGNLSGTWARTER